MHYCAVYTDDGCDTVQKTQHVIKDFVAVWPSGNVIGCINVWSQVTTEMGDHSLIYCFDI